MGNNLEVRLTADQIKTLDEVAFDRRAVEKTLLVAVNYATNRFNELDKLHTEAWAEIFEQAGLSINEEGWTGKTKKSNGSCFAVFSRTEEGEQA